MKLVPAKAGMVSGKLPLHLLFQPLPGFVVLAGWAMAIAAGTIHEVWFTTLLTAVERSTTTFRATLTDGLHRFSMFLGDSFTIALHILGAKGSEDVIDVVHATAPPSLG
jgi:hypothetical protein